MPFKHNRPTAKASTKHQTLDSRKLSFHQGEPQNLLSNTAAAGGKRSSSGSEKQQLQEAEGTAGQRQQQQQLAQEENDEHGRAPKSVCSLSHSSEIPDLIVKILGAVNAMHDAGQSEFCSAAA